MESSFRYSYSLGESVYVKTDPNQYPRLITGYILRPSNLVKYLVTSTDFGELECFDFEVTTEKTLII